ncbi:hypothetical protein ACROYT_G011311 [Oculina patagonica]
MDFKLIVVVIVVLCTWNCSEAFSSNSRIGKRSSLRRTVKEELQSRQDIQGFCRTAMQLCQGQNEDEASKPNLRREIEESY